MGEFDKYLVEPKPFPHVSNAPGPDLTADDKLAAIRSRHAVEVKSRPGLSFAKRPSKHKPDLFAANILRSSDIQSKPARTPRPPHDGDDPTPKGFSLASAHHTHNPLAGTYKSGSNMPTSEASTRTRGITAFH